MPAQQELLLAGTIPEWYAKVRRKPVSKRYYRVRNSRCIALVCGHMHESFAEAQECLEECEEAAKLLYGYPIPFFITLSTPKPVKLAYGTHAQFNGQRYVEGQRGLASRVRLFKPHTQDRGALHDAIYHGGGNHGEW